MRLIFFTIFTIAFPHYSFSTMEGVILDKTLSIVFNTMDLLHPQESDKIREQFLNSMLKNKNDSELIKHFRNVLDLFYKNGSPFVQAKIRNVMKMLKDIDPSELRTIFRSYKNSEESVGQVKKQHNSWDVALDFLATEKEGEEMENQPTFQESAEQWVAEDNLENAYNEEDNELKDPLEQLSSDEEGMEGENEKDEKFFTVFPSYFSTEIQDDYQAETKLPKQKDRLSTKVMILTKTLTEKGSQDYLDELQNVETDYQSFQEKYLTTSSNVIKSSSINLTKDSLLNSKVRSSSLPFYLRSTTSAYMNMSTIKEKNHSILKNHQNEPSSSTLGTTWFPTLSSADSSTKNLSKDKTYLTIDEVLLKKFPTEKASGRKLPQSFSTAKNQTKNKEKPRASLKPQITTVSSLESTSLNSPTIKHKKKPKSSRNFTKKRFNTTNDD